MKVLQCLHVKNDCQQPAQCATGCFLQVSHYCALSDSFRPSGMQSSRNFLLNDADGSGRSDSVSDRHHASGLSCIVILPFNDSPRGNTVISQTTDVVDIVWPFI